MTKSLLFYDKIIFSLLGCILRLSRVNIPTEGPFRCADPHIGLAPHDKFIELEFCDEFNLITQTLEELNY